MTDYDYRITVDIDTTNLVTDPNGGQLPDLLAAVRQALEDFGLSDDEFVAVGVDLPDGPPWAAPANLGEDTRTKAAEIGAARAEVTAPPEPEEAPAAVDLMAALRASVERAQSARGEGKEDEQEREPVAPTPITSATAADVKLGEQS